MVGCLCACRSDGTGAPRAVRRDQGSVFLCHFLEENKVTRKGSSSSPVPDSFRDPFPKSRPLQTLTGLSVPHHAEAARLGRTETTAPPPAADLGHREGGHGGAGTQERKEAFIKERS